MSGLHLTDVVVTPPGGRPVAVPRLRVAFGEVVAVVGVGGVGKSVLVDGLAGLAPATGSIAIDGTELVGRAPHERVRAGLATVPSRRPSLAELTVRDHLELVRRGRSPDRQRRWSRRAVLAALPGLDRVLDAEVASVGAWERVATGLAAALRTEPRAVVVDEPVAGLAGAGAGLDRLRAALFRLSGTGMAVVLLTRDLPAARSLSHRVVHLDRSGVLGPAPAPGRSDRGSHGGAP